MNGFHTILFTIFTVRTAILATLIQLQHPLVMRSSTYLVKSLFHYLWLFITFTIMFSCQPISFWQQLNYRFCNIPTIFSLNIKQNTYLNPFVQNESSALTKQMALILINSFSPFVSLHEISCMFPKLTFMCKMFHAKKLISDVCVSSTQSNF